MLKIYNNKNYDVREIFEKYKKDLLNTSESSEFIKLFNLYYIDYWYYIHNNITIEEYVIQNHNEIYENNMFIKFLLKKLANKNIKNIVKLICPYITFHEKIKNSLIQNYVDIIKNGNVIYVKDEFETILNLFFYRRMATFEFKTFHEFYLKTFLQSTTKYDKFIKYIPLASSISLFNNKGSITNINTIHVKNVIDFIFKYLNVSYTIIKKKNEIHITSDSNIIIVKMDILNSLDREMINTVKINNTITFNKIIIKLKTIKIITLSQLLTSIHLLTIGIKTINAEPSNIYEFENLLSYDGYFKDSFKIFFIMIKPNINVNIHYNKFLIEIIKYFYLYAVADFYFYATPDLANIIIKDADNKIDLMRVFFEDLQNDFQIPTSMLPYPPFIQNQQYNIDDIMYYCYDHPNYFKLFDFLEALFEIMNVKHCNEFDEAFLKCIHETKITNSNTVKKITKTKPIINETDDAFYELTDSQF